MAAPGPSLDAALRVAREFDLPSDQLQRGVDEFLNQMAEGLEKDGTTLSQIPTYVTSVPNGTEKVCCLVIFFSLHLFSSSMTQCTFLCYFRIRLNYSQSMSNSY